jgi:hypothetical protein
MAHYSGLKVVEEIVSSFNRSCYLATLAFPTLQSRTAQQPLLPWLQLLHFCCTFFFRVFDLINHRQGPNHHQGHMHLFVAPPSHLTSFGRTTFPSDLRILSARFPLSFFFNCLGHTRDSHSLSMPPYHCREESKWVSSSCVPTRGCENVPMVQSFHLLHPLDECTTGLHLACVLLDFCRHTELGDALESVVQHVPFSPSWAC